MLRSPCLPEPSRTTEGDLHHAKVKHPFSPSSLSTTSHSKNVPFKQPAPFKHTFHVTCTYLLISKVLLCRNCAGFGLCRKIFAFAPSQQWEDRVPCSHTLARGARAAGSLCSLLSSSNSCLNADSSVFHRLILLLPTHSHSASLISPSWSFFSVMPSLFSLGLVDFS